MQTEIRIKDLFVSLWENKIKLLIITCSLCIVFILGLMYMSKITKSVSTEIQLAWEGEKYEYPNGTTLVSTDLISRDILEIAKNRLALEIDIDGLYERNAFEVTELNPTIIDKTRKYELKFKTNGSKLSDEEAELFLKEIITVYNEYLISMEITKDFTINDFDIKQDYIYNVYIIHKSLTISTKALFDMKNNMPNYTFEGETISGLQKDTDSILNLNMDIYNEIFDKVSEQEYNIISKYSIDEFLSNLSKVISFELHERASLKQEMDTLNDLIMNSGQSDVKEIISRIQKLNKRITTLDDIILPFKNIIDKCTNSLVQCNVKSSTPSELGTVNDELVKLFGLSTANLDTNKAAESDYASKMVRTVFLNAKEVRTKTIFNTLYILIVMIVAFGISVISIWIIVDWDVRQKNRKNLKV